MSRGAGCLAVEGTVRELVITRPQTGQARSGCAVREREWERTRRGALPPKRSAQDHVSFSHCGPAQGWWAVPHLSREPARSPVSVGHRRCHCLAPAKLGPVTRPGKLTAREQTAEGEVPVGVWSAALMTGNHSGAAFAISVVTTRWPLCHEAAQQDGEKPAPRWRSPGAPRRPRPACVLLASVTPDGLQKSKCLSPSTSPRGPL